ncbi:Alpha/beta hydrolase fold-1 domain-containing protein [Penicillium ucsense]|uniref:Alpha/beta hydrolase fold-1 domain-containing protein n=2 Tax=Penicillium TaxID=5073 RepID=A0A8J8WLX3_9EURO|nr:Alpha/beta hydrolase fold-1 [Penicillium diatomitis]KAF7718841.1 Alpha/beta hydrolase fold-1 domain-containing protein [Penicillium ucsense]KAF7735086.1 Alpha/beta hydrolase fold-1 domain-containing protein [Penicillium ucsense]KAJ5469232.1 Alpha/beta hydrolase fold-1 [Penicillium diatomitis]
MSETPISYTSHNVSSPKATILLIHGGFSDGQEWDPIWPLLVAADYHVMIPDLPGHGNSCDAGRGFAVEDAARRLADLVQAHALDQKAHVVAMSIGAHVAAAMAARYPEQIQSLVVSGFNMFPPSLVSPVLPYFVYAVQRTSGFIKNPTVEWRRFCKGQGTLSTTCDIFNMLFSARALKPIAARSLVVAATRAGISADNIDHARRLFETIQPDNGSRLVQHRGMRHPWNADEPRIFTNLVTCWAERKDLPEGFESVV